MRHVVYQRTQAPQRHQGSDCLCDRSVVVDRDLRHYLSDAQAAEWTATFVTVLLLIGFPVALIFAWAYELTPEGLKKEKGPQKRP